MEGKVLVVVVVAAAAVVVVVAAVAACYGATFFARDQPCASEEQVLVVVAAADQPCTRRKRWWWWWRRWLVMKQRFLLGISLTRGGEVVVMRIRKIKPSLYRGHTQRSWAIGNDPLCKRTVYAPNRSSKPHPQAQPPETRLKPRPVFVASGGVIIGGKGGGGGGGDGGGGGGMWWKACFWNTHFRTFYDQH